MLTGTCHCGSAGWTLAGDPGPATICNCTLCRRYGVLWAYDYENQRIRISGHGTPYIRADAPEPCLEIRFCTVCGCVICWRALQQEPDGRRRIAVNLRLAPPEAVAELPIRRFEGLNSLADLPVEGRCVRDYWF